jgi:DNA-binding response OmpR family regulator
MTSIRKNVLILYVEDDETIAYLTRDNLELRGYTIDHVPDGRQALEHFRSNIYDLCLVDIMLPELDGYTLAMEIRKLNSSVPILFLTAKSLTEDKIRGLTLGADDYITKPFSIDELVLRIEVFLRRSSMSSDKVVQLIHIGKSEYDFANQTIKIADRKITLTQRENELLKFLIENSNRLIRREEILKNIWGDDDYFLGRSLDVFISRLRKIFRKEPSVEIENVHGVGFRFNTGR